MFGSFLGVVVLATSAWAGELEMRWSEAHTYVIRSDVGEVRVIPVNATRNQDANMLEWSLALVTTCTPVASFKKETRWEVRCTIDALSLGALGPAGDRAGALLENLNEWTETLTNGGWFQLIVGSDGVLQSATLEGVTGDRPRERDIRTWMREVLFRAYAGFDVPLPKRGPGTTWAQSGVDATHLFVEPHGTTGILEGGHRRDDTDAGKVLIQTNLTGTLSPTGRRAINEWQSALRGQCLLDPNTGTLLERQYEFVAKPSASSLSNNEYVQRLALRLLAPGEKPPVLPPNRMVESVRTTPLPSRFGP
ncbi:MAG: hypothetical protein GWP91_11765 [Rhodobacterales bacterium]|nr:hypothetical protein [Rhodobacterales bacterium]